MATVKNILQSTELAFARNPSINWISDSDAVADGPEEGATGVNVGVGVLDAVSCYVQVNPAVYNTGKSSFHTISSNTFVSDGTYTIVLDGVSYVTTGESTVALAIQELVDDINDPAKAFAIGGGGAFAISMNGSTVDTVFVFKSGGTFTVNATVAGGTPALTTTYADFRSYTDATACSARIWVQFVSPQTSPITLPWTLVSNGDIGVIPDQGFVERLNAAGFSRLYVEIYTATLHGSDGAGMIARPLVLIAPAIPEE